MTSGERRAARAALWVASLLLVLSSCFVGCSGSDRAATVSARTVAGDMPCVDADGDGFGSACVAGADCDDHDSSVHTGCVECSQVRTGCTCDAPGSRVSCGEVQTVVDGQVTCGLGDRVCSNGKWSECVINESVRLLPGGDPKTKLLTLGSAQDCPDPCDPYCVHWPDTPVGLTDTNNGIVATSSGIGLGQMTGTLPQSACMGGSVAACAHHLCQTGSALSAGCDTQGQTYCVAKGDACSSSLPCCYGLSCVSGTCQVPGTGTPNVIFSDDFSGGNSKGWSLDTEWAIGTATLSGSRDYGNRDPSSDASPTSDNYLAGVVIGGNAAQSLHGYRYLTSPQINTASAYGTMLLKFSRWLNSDYSPYMDNRVEVYNGSTWTAVYTTGGSPGVTDSSWQTISIDVSSYKSASFKVRFGFQVGNSSVRKVSGWNLDDVSIVSDVAPVACAATGASCASSACCTAPSCSSGVCTMPSSCVSQICASRPSCCTGSWDINCVNMVTTTCNLECAIDAASTCVLCYKDSIDHDGDGYSHANGDCKDCDSAINPGAYDFPGNGIDEDCSNVSDDEVTSCDSSLTFASSDPNQYAKAIDLCRFTSAGATGASRTWGVISASLVKADGSACSDSLQRAITSRFGANNVPLAGASMAAFSSGTARDADDPGYIAPSGQNSSYNANTYAAPPSGFPRSAVGCPNGTAAYDSCGLKLKIRAPTNAASLSYAFNFYTSEYAEWVCTQYNDSFIALYNSAANTIADKNISFDSSGNPVSVNIGFFSVPGNQTITSHPVLNGTGFDGTCNNTQYGFPANGVCGGATNWLATTAPVSKGEEFDLTFLIWDTGDHVWDSTVLIDKFQWSQTAATIKTLPIVSVPTNEYSPGDFIRTYDGTVCPAGTSPVWGLWSWTASTPSDSSIQFYVKAASSLAGLATAVEHPLKFTNPPGPSAVAGTAAIAKASGTDTQNGSLVVDTNLKQLGVSPQLPFVRIRSRLTPSTNKLSAPTLSAWNQDVSCRPNE